jgi:DNA-directed RNA polymerase specialized sigma24 family protein
MPEIPSREPGPPEAAQRLVAEVFGDADYLDRLETMLRARVHLDEADVLAIVEIAVVEAVRQSRAGKAIEDPRGVVWWLAERKAGELSAGRGETLELDEAVRFRPAPEVSTSELARWRALIEQIDQERPRQVWLLVIGALEAGEDMLTGFEIARHLGIPELAVRQALTRGRKQLRRLIEAAGLVRTLDDGSLIVAFCDDDED